MQAQSKDPIQDLINKTQRTKTIPPDQNHETNINSIILGKFLEAIKEETAGILLFQNLWIQSCGSGTVEIQSLVRSEEDKNLKAIKDCAKFAIILFGGEAAQRITIAPCEETLIATNNAKGLRKAIELAYQWTMKTRSIYIDLSNILKNEHPDIAEWGILSAKEKLESFYIFQSLLS